jgi:hypothetical protein
MAFGKPTLVPPGLGSDDYEKIRQEIEDNMVAASEQCEEKVRQLKGDLRIPETSDLNR